jgi:hypothetical protein
VQFYLPPEGRMLFGLGYAAAAALFAVGAWRAGRGTATVSLG